MNKKCCGTCKHYRGHYVRYSDGRFVPIPHGHCVHPRLKNRHRETDACVHWAAKEKGGSR